MSAKTLLAVSLLAVAVSGIDAADDDWEHFADGSLGQQTEFRGAGGLVIPAYIRKPKGDGPFPVVVMLHGGRYHKGASAGMGRSTKAPVADFLQKGWAVYCTDYRPNDKISIEPIETEDTIAALKAVRQLPFIDPRRVGLWGASHGANVASRVIARADLGGAILCAPAAMDLIEVKKADARSEPIVPILRKLIADMEQKHGAKAEAIEKDPAKYGYSSAMTEIAQVRCPLLIINARNDDNSPVSIIERYVQKLRAAGKQVETYLPAQGGHGFYVGRPDGPEWKEATRRSLAFFTERFAQGPSSPPSLPPRRREGEGDERPATEPKTPALEQYGALNWVDPDRMAPPGTTYKTFRSKTIDADVSYLVYLPPEYDKDQTARYPVLYYLHASGGTPRRGAAGIVPRMDAAMRAGRVAPLIIVFPNGLRGATMYCDSKDGKYPVESVLVQDLIPHVDATYRTVAAHHGRAVDGFSMGGFGSAHLGFKYPAVFGVVSIQAPPLLDPDLKSPLPARAWSRLFPTAMGGDLEYFRANDPFALVPRNAEALRDRSVIRIITHVEDENWLAPRCEELHRLLMKHRIAHQFLYLANVKTHSPNQVLDTLGDAGLMFFGAGFAHLQRGQLTSPPPPAKAEAKVDTPQLTPLTDLGTNKYQGFPGGLYPDGKNSRPADHEAAGKALAKLVQPLAADGKPSANGKIVLLAIGFSNTVQAFNGFMQAAADDKDINPNVVLVNGAMGGMSAHMVQDPDDKGSGTKYWSWVDERLKAAGVTRAQVQAVWIKETNPGPHQGGFPKYIRDLQSEITKIVKVLPGRFPNAKLVYLSSRTYGGWAKAPPGRRGGPGNSEPYSYETGFAVKWLLERQLKGDPELNYEPKNGAVKAPWLSWGPYLWANGQIKRQDGYSFELSDFRENDRMHHSPQGQKKIGAELLRFFKTDSTTREWFLRTERHP
jgi:dipeptidyl aminopeptidase/acylaminoacyl peptidase